MCNRLWGAPLRIALLTLMAVSMIRAQGAPGAGRDPLNRQLPDWLTLGTHNRVRFESRDGLDLDPEQHEAHMESRLRLRVGVQPSQSFRLFLEAQDSRVAWVDPEMRLRRSTNPFDLRRAQIVVGDEEQGLWDLSVGRQELAFGSERLIGINQWSNVSRVFDTVKLALHRGENRVDIFAASVVAIDRDGFDHRRDGDNVHGIYASLGGVVPGVRFEPHVFYRTRLRATAERGLEGDDDSYTAGFRLASTGEHRWDFQTEMDWQFGTAGPEDLRAFLGLWGVDYKPPLPLRPRFLAEYTYASGDSDPGDGRVETFDQLYARAHRILGIADLVGGRNIKALLTGAHFRLSPKTTVRLDHHFFWLASRRDGLYRANGSLYVQAPSGGASDSYVGHELDLQFVHNLSRYLRLGAGVARFSPGAFLQQTTPGAAQTFGFVFLEFEL